MQDLDQRGDCLGVPMRLQGVCPTIVECVKHALIGFEVLFFVGLSFYSNKGTRCDIAILLRFCAVAASKCNEL